MGSNAGTVYWMDIFQFDFFKNCIVFLKRPKINKKRLGLAHFYKKSTEDTQLLHKGKYHCTPGPIPIKKLLCKFKFHFFFKKSDWLLTIYNQSELSKMYVE